MELQQHLNIGTTTVRNGIKGRHFPISELEDAIKNRQMINPSMDLSNACNLNCPYCFLGGPESKVKHKKEDELSLKETFAIIDEFAEVWAKTINLVGAGEPTIDPHFKEVVKYIYNKGIIPTVATNGIRLATDSTLIDFLYENGASVIIKVNSFNSELQDLLAWKRGYGKQRDKALKLLIEKWFNQEYPTRLGVNAIALNNTDELLAVHKRCIKNNIFPIMSDYIPTGRTEWGEFQGQEAIPETFTPTEKKQIEECLNPITSQQKQELYNAINEFDKELEIEKTLTRAYYGWAICTQSLGVYVDIEWNIYPCVAKSHMVDGQQESWRLGNIREGASVKEIRNAHPYMNEIIENFDWWCPYKARINKINEEAKQQTSSH